MEIGGGNIVDPCLDGRAAAFNAEMVPAFGSEGAACGLIVFQIVEPGAATFLLHAAGPRARGGIDLDLQAVHSTGGHLDGATFAFELGRLVESVAANLDTGVKARIDFK